MYVDVFVTSLLVLSYHVVFVDNNKIAGICSRWDVQHTEIASTCAVHDKCLSSLKKHCGGRGYDDSVPGEVTKTAPSGDRTTLSPTWSVSLSRIQLIPPDGWSNMSPVRTILVPSPLKRGQICYIPSPLKIVVYSVCVVHSYAVANPVRRLLDKNI